MPATAADMLLPFLLFESAAANGWPQCEPADCDAGVSEGCGCLRLLRPEECPADIYSTYVHWNCRGASYGSLCEGDGRTCGTDDNASNCMVSAHPR